MKDNSEIGFEKELWASADKLRGSMDSSEYKHVILGLVFLKYISDKFEERYKELVENGDGYEEDKDAYTESNIFFVPEKSRFGYISENARLPEIGNIIDEAMQKIEKENSRLKNILPKNYSRPELDKRRLGEIIDLSVEHGIIEKSGSWYAYQGNKIGQGKENVKQYLNQNKPLQIEIENKLRKKIGIDKKEAKLKP